MKKIYFFMFMLSFGLNAQTKAFPTAEGFGKYAQGGRGGTVLKVTNLNDSGAGSLRAACEASGARTVVFTLGGRINLSSTIDIADPYITIAGQSAPADSGGITVSIDGTPNQPIMRINASEVIVRYMTFRRSEQDTSESNSDGLYITAGTNIIIDHCSVSWCSDENLPITEYSATPTTNITVQNSIIAAAYGGTSKGSLVAHPNNISFFRNAFIHNGNRNPQIATNPPEAPNRDGFYEVINNVIYGYKYGALFHDNDNVTSPKGKMKLNFIKNKGFQPSGQGNNRRLLLVASATDVDVYVSGNIDPNRTSDAMDEWEITQGVDGASNINVLADLDFQVLTPISTQIVNDGIALYDANDVWSNIKADVGNSYPARDSFDTLMVDDLDNLTDSHNATDNSTLGFPTLASGTSPTDTDNDGMPDTWEIANGLDPNVNDATDNDLDANYDNLEIFLNLVDGESEEDTEDPTSPTGLSSSSITSNAFTLTWTASTDNVGVTSYDVYRGVTLAANVASGTTYNETGLSPSTTYTYTVVGKDSAGNSSTPSSGLEVTTTATSTETVKVSKGQMLLIN